MKPSDYSLKRNWRGYLLVVPACIAIFLVSIYPMLYGISLAFQNYTLTKANSDDFRTFAGLKNFIEIFKQSDYIQACQNTLFWTLTNVIVQVVLAVLIALALNRKIKGRGFFRTTALIPWAVPSVIAALTFRFLYDANVGIINKENIAKMKDGVIIINNSRGQMVVEQDLADALNSGKVAFAGLDVVSTEPIRADNPLLTAKNCIITPHMSWGSQGSRQRIMDCTVNNIRAFLSGAPENVVNP